MARATPIAIAQTIGECATATSSCHRKKAAPRRVRLLSERCIVGFGSIRPGTHRRTRKIAGKFECCKDKAGEFRFRLKAGNGEIILASEGYRSKDVCLKGVASVKNNCINPGRFEKKTTDSGKFRFNLKSSNGQVIGTSQTYESESGCDNGVKSVASSAPDGTIVDQA